MNLVEGIKKAVREESLAKDKRIMESISFGFSLSSEIPVYALREGKMEPSNLNDDAYSNGYVRVSDIPLVIDWADILERESK